MVYVILVQMAFTWFQKVVAHVMLKIVILAPVVLTNVMLVDVLILIGEKMLPLVSNAQAVV